MYIYQVLSSFTLLILFFSFFLIREAHTKPTGNASSHHRQVPAHQYYTENQSVGLTGKIEETPSTMLLQSHEEKPRPKRSPYPPGFVMWSSRWAGPCYCPTGSSKCRCPLNEIWGSKVLSTKSSKESRRKKRAKIL